MLHRLIWTLWCQTQQTDAIVASPTFHHDGLVLLVHPAIDNVEGGGGGDTDQEEARSYPPHL